MYWKYKYDVTKKEGKRVNVNEDPNPIGLDICMGGVYYNNDGKWVYPLDIYDDHDIEHEYQPFTIWYRCVVTDENASVNEFSKFKYYHSHWYEFDPETKNCDETNGIEGPVQFSRNRTILDLKVGDRIALNNLLIAVVTEVLNPGFIVEIVANDCYSGSLRLNKQGNAVNHPECLSNPQEFKLGWFNFNRVL